MSQTAGPGAPGGQPSRRLAAIMFTDLVGYSAMAHRDEGLAIELLELHRAWVREILPSFGGIEIETVGDAFLIEFAGALAAVECAVAIQRRFAEHNAAAPAERRMELRVGIHLGDVEHRDGKVMGDGVNIASRIHGMARPGGVCVSEGVYQVVRNRPAFQFVSLGTPALKNISHALELFELAPSTAPAPAAIAQASAAVPRRWRPALAAAGGAALVAIAIALWLALRAPAHATPSIAVLPFDNLSAEADSAYFTDGLHDTVIGHLSRVRELKVISRTSVMGYRGQRANLRRIAAELGVNHILEGSVQRAGDRLRVAAQLIETATDTHVWSNEYDRDLKDVFAVQADIAQQVASAVHARLTPQETAAIAAAPTRDQQAYDLYLRALAWARSGEINPDRARQAIGWLEEAVARDPGFALAHALLATTHDFLHWYGFDPTDERRRRIDEHAARALALDPQLPEARVARGMSIYHGSRDYAGALRELEIARGLAPGNATVYLWIGPIYRRQGRWDEALAAYEKSEALDPLNGLILNELNTTLFMMRRYEEAERVAARMHALEPGSALLATGVAYMRFLRTGELQPLRQALDAAPPGDDPACQVSGTRVQLEMLARRFDAALAAANQCSERMLFVGAMEQVPRLAFVAQTRWFKDGRRVAPPEAAGVRAELEQMLARRDDQPAVRMQLALTLLMLGQRQQALAEVERALAQMPVSRDALTGPQILRSGAEVRALAGEGERALDDLEQLVRMPNGVHLQELKLHPVWDGLRDHPRFQRLIDGAQGAAGR